MDWIVNKPNNVRQKQIAMQAQAGKNLVFLRGGRSKVYFSAYMVLFTCSFVGSMTGLFQYGMGTAKKAGEE